MLSLKAVVKTEEDQTDPKRQPDKSVFQNLGAYNFEAVSGSFAAVSNVSDQQILKCYRFMNALTCGNRISDLPEFPV